MSLNEHASLAVSIEGKSTESLVVPGRATKQLYTLVPNSPLPAEILSQIFELAVLPSPCTSIAFTKRQVHPLAVIPSVCTTWRQLAINLGSLWSHVDVHVGVDLEDDYTTTSLNRMVLWLERASSAPILNFHVTPQDAEDVDPQLYDILRPHMSRAVSLTFSRVGIVHAQDILNLYAACRPPGQLQVLSITGTVPDYSSTNWFGWPIRSLPCLTVLELLELSVQVCPNMDELVWMLSNSPALHTLRLVGASGIEYQDYPRIILPNLKYVEISPISSSARYYGILKALVPGNLALHARVWLALSGSADKDGLSAFIAFLKRSNTVYLYFKEPGFSRLGLEYLEVLDSVPRLQFLSFESLGAPHYSMHTPTALGKIFDGTGPHVRRNGLRVLHVQHMSMDQSMWDRMQQVIETRQPEKIIIGPDVKGLDDIIELGQGTRLDWLRERIGLVVYGEHVEFPIGENLS